MRKERLNYVRSIKLNLCRATALRVTRSLESTVEDVDSPLPVANTEKDEWARDAGRKGRRST